MGKGATESFTRVFDPLTLDGSADSSKALSQDVQEKLQALRDRQGLDEGLKNNAWARNWRIVTDGAIKYSLSGAGKAWEHDLETGDWKTKLVTGAAMGIAMRFVLPKAGALKALVGTAMTGLAAVDLVKPFSEACAMGDKAKTFGDLKKASKHAGHGVGAFAVDTALTLPIGIAGEHVTGYGLERTKIGRSIEAFKENKLFSRTSPIGQALSSAFAPFTEKPSHELSKFEKAMHARAKKYEGLTLEQIIQKDDLKLSHKEKTEFLNDMEEMVLTANLNKQKKKGGGLELEDHQVERLQEKRAQHMDKYNKWLEVNEIHNVEPVTKENVISSSEPTTKEVAASDKPASKSASAIELSTEKKAYFDHEQFTDLAKTARRLETEMSPKRQELEAVKDELKMMIVAASDPGTKTVLPPDYIPNTIKLIAMINSIESAQELRMVGDYLSMLNVSCQQLLTNHPTTRMMLIYSIMSDMRLKKGILDAGLSPEILKGIVPATATVEYSLGGPAIWPAGEDVGWNVASVPFEYLLRVPTLVAKLGAYGHEFKGHGRSGKKPDGSGKIWRFDEDERHDLIKNVVKQALNGHDEVMMLSNGKPLKDTNGKNVMLSEWMESELLSCSEELTADMMGFVDNGLTLPHSLNNLVAGFNDNFKIDLKGMISPAYASSESPWGREGHPYTTFRDECAKEMHMQLARHPERFAEAEALGKMVDATREKGDNYLCEIFKIGRGQDGRQQHQYTGVDIVVPKQWMDKAARPLVQAQFFTPIKRHGGKTIKDMIVDYQTTYDKMMSLAPVLADAIAQGKTEIPTFDKNQYDMVDIANAGYLAMLHPKAANIPMEKRLETAGKIMMSLSSEFDDLLKVRSGNQASIPNIFTEEGRKIVSDKAASRAFNLAGSAARFFRTFPENVGTRLAPTVATQMPQTIQVGELMMQHMLKKDMEEKSSKAN